MDKERKSLTLEFKADDEPGAFSAAFSTFDVIDSDQDVTRPGAFEKGAPVIVGSWGHKTNELPVGKAAIQSDDHEATIEGQFFLDTQPGKDTYQTVKNLGAIQEWSYVFRVTKQSFGEFEGQQVRFIESAKVFSVDPVLAGAGINTRTIDIKSLSTDLTFMEHGDQFVELLDEYVDRVKSRAAVREQDGRALSAANVERLSGIAESLKSASGDLEQLLASKQDVDLVAEFLRYQKIRARF